MKVRKRQFTKVVKEGNKFSAYFVVDNQSFVIIRWSTKKNCEWFCDMFDHALRKVVGEMLR